MVYCPSCSEQQDDSKSFCRFCGHALPGQELMLKLRQEALNLASLKSGRNLSEAQSENQQTLANLKRNGEGDSTFKPVNNGDHLHSTKMATDNLKNLMD